jgi:hypothetical protein
VGSKELCASRLSSAVAGRPQLLLRGLAGIAPQDFSGGCGAGRDPSGPASRTRTRHRCRIADRSHAFRRRGIVTRGQEQDPHAVLCRQRRSQSQGSPQGCREVRTRPGGRDRRRPDGQRHRPLSGAGRCRGDAGGCFRGPARESPRSTAPQRTQGGRARRAVTGQARQTDVVDRNHDG